MTAGPQLQRRGLGFVVAFPSLGVTLEINRLREHGGELSGELTVTMKDSVTSRDRHLTRARFNVSSLTARRTMGGSLARIEGAGAVPWDLVLEQFCVAVLDAHRAGQPWESVGGPVEDQDSTDDVEIVHPIIWAGAPSLIFAPGGSGKSTLAAAVAVSVETGVSVVPGWKVLSAPVAVLDWEDNAAEWGRQIRAVSRGAGIAPPLIAYRRMAGGLADQVEEISAYVMEHGIGLVIVDSVEAASGSGRDGDSFNDRVQRLFDAVRLLGCAALLLDHVAGGDLDRDSASSKPYGGVFKLNRARAVFELRAESEPTPERIELVLLDTKRNRRAKLAPQSMVIHFEDFDAQGRAQSIRYESGAVTAPDLVRRLTATEQMAHLLQSGALPTKALAEELGISESAIRTYVSRSSKFTRLPDGRVGLAR